MDNSSKEIYKNIGEAVVDTAMTATSALTFGISTHVVDFADRTWTHFKNIKREHSVRQLRSFYETPSRTNKDDFDKFKEKHKDHQDIILDLLKTLDLTINKKQSEMLAKLLELYVLSEIDERTYVHWKHIIPQLDDYLTQSSNQLYIYRQQPNLPAQLLLPIFFQFGFIKEKQNTSILLNGVPKGLNEFYTTPYFIDFYKKLYL